MDSEVNSDVPEKEKMPGNSNGGPVVIEDIEDIPPPPKYTEAIGSPENGIVSPGTPDSENEKEKEKEKKEVKKPMVGLGELFKFAEGKDRAMMVGGMIAACINGASTPLMIIVFGTVIDTFLGNDQSINFWETYGADITAEYNVTFEEFVSNSTLSLSVCTSLGITKACSELATGASDVFFSKINELIVYFLIIAAGTFVVSYIQLVGFQIPAYRQGQKIRKKLFYSILRQEIGWFDTHEVGELNTRLAEDVNQIEAGIGEKLGSFFQYICAFIAGFVAGMAYGWKLTLVIVAMTPLIIIASGLLSKLQSSFTTRELTAYAKAGAVAEEVFGAIRTVVAFGGEAKESNRYENNLVAAKTQGVKKGMIAGMTVGFTFFLLFAAYALAFWYGAKLIREDPEYTAGRLLIIFFCILIGAFSLGSASPSIENLATARGAAHVTYAIIESEPHIDSSSSEGLRPPISGNVEFKDVYFQYPSRPDVPVLQGLKLSVNVGQTVALVGSSGCGKSTTIQLLQRFYDPAQGSVYIDGTDIREMNVRWLREHIGVVSQEPVLFATTIGDNIRYGRDGVTDDEIQQAARKANAHDFIAKLPLGYDTLVGERGAQLSGGQKQRIAIARALVRDPKILLLDEATSALDTTSESIVQSALDKARQGRTTIVIAHRLSTIKTADVIAGFDKGVVAEKGTHDELMALEGIYHTLVTNQTEARDNGSEMEEVEEEEEEKKSEGETSEVAIVNSRPELIRMVTSPGRSDPPITDKHELQGYLVGEKKKDESEDLPPVPLTRIMKLNAPETCFIIIGCIAAFINGAIQPLFSIIFSSIISLFGQTDLEKQTEDVKLYSGLFLAMGFAALLANLFQEWGLAVSGENLTMRLRNMAFKAMMRQDISWFDQEDNNVGALTTRLATDASTVKGATGSQLALVLKTLSSIVIGVTIGFYYSWKLTLVILCFAPVIFLSSFIRVKLASGGISARDKKAMEGAGKVAIEAVENMRTVAALTKEEQFYRNYCVLVDIPHKKRMKRSGLDGLAFGLSQGIQFVINAAVFAYGAHLIKNEGLPFDSMFKVFAAIIFTASAVGQSSSFGPDLAKAKLAAARIMAIVDREPAIDAYSEQGQKPDQSEGVVQFEDVHFNYPSRQNVKVLQGLDLSVSPGQTTALVGSSGCGKSTTIQLLERFYDPIKGTVKLDSHNVKDLNVSWLRSQISLVSQEPVLFAYSIRENIEYGDNNRDVGMDDVIAAAKSANIHNFIQSLPQGYETNVGEKGTQLSGGQKQRVAIARALIRNPKILLLDEATSALDTESEKVVQEALDNARQGRTCIVIAHRLSTIRNADSIAVIHNGQVAEQGTHDELMTKEGFYYKLQNIQPDQN